MINIYKMTCETGKTYYGSTKQTLKRRLKGHKDKKNCSCKDFINPKIELLETCEKEQQKEREGYYVRNFECVNIYIPDRTVKEWFKDNDITHKENQKKWYEDNKEKRKKKIKCECGLMVSNAYLTNHKKTKKHLKLISSGKNKIYV